MNNDFISILQKLIIEHGKDVLLNYTRCKAILADYTSGEYKKETRVLLQAIEVGVSKAIDTTEDMSICKTQQIRLLNDDYAIAEDIAAKIIDTLIYILKGEKKEKIVCKCSKELADEWNYCPFCGINKHNIYEIDNNQIHHTGLREIGDPTTGKIYNGIVKRIESWGAFVEIFQGKEGILHISKLSRKRINEVTDIIEVGQQIPVKLLEIDRHGRLNLSHIDAIEQSL